jgi:Fic family protein
MTRSVRVNAKSTGASVGKFADVVGLLWRASRTVREVVKVTGVGIDTTARYFAVLEAEGLIVRDGSRDRSAVYRWVDR